MADLWRFTALQQHVQASVQSSALALPGRPLVPGLEWLLSRQTLLSSPWTENFAKTQANKHIASRSLPIT